jgi:DNA replication protein DnaC
MLNQPTIDRLRDLKLPGMALALQRQIDQPELHRLAFEERLALLVDAEITHRDSERLKRLLRQAQFRQQAALEDLDTRPTRGLDRSLVATLASGEWIHRAHNLVITGPTGTGKSWIAQAFGNAACRQGFSVRYERTGRLLELLRTARADASYHKRLTALTKGRTADPRQQFSV